MFSRIGTMVTFRCLNFSTLMLNVKFKVGENMNWPLRIQNKGDVHKVQQEPMFDL